MYNCILSKRTKNKKNNYKWCILICKFNKNELFIKEINIKCNKIINKAIIITQNQ